MSVPLELEKAVPGSDVPGGGESSFRRILIPVRSPDESAEALAAAARVCSSTINGLLRLIHIRIYDPPMPKCPGRFYPETVAEAKALLDEALLIVWGSGGQAATAVIDAPRGEVAAAIAQQASAWCADVIVLTRRPRPTISRALLGSVADQVMRKASCPVLTVHPKRK
jgi:nucleotide-binding universal stress UspA family protein